MAVTANMVPLSWKDAVCGTLSGRLQQGQIGAVLCSGYTFDPDNHHFLTSAMAFEITGTGYVSLGATVTGSTVSYDPANNEIVWDTADPTWTTASFSASMLVYYDRFAGGTTTTWPMLEVVAFGGTQTVTAGTFSYVVPSNGAAAFTGF